MLKPYSRGQSRLCSRLLLKGLLTSALTVADHRSASSSASFVGGAADCLGASLRQCSGRSRECDLLGRRDGRTRQENRLGRIPRVARRCHAAFSALPYLEQPGLAARATSCRWPSRLAMPKARASQAAGADRPSRQRGAVWSCVSVAVPGQSPGAALQVSVR